jgi:phosphatidylglycerophosphate synthase
VGKAALRNAANMLTLLSGAAAVLGMAVEGRCAAISLLIAGQLLDVLDGWIARRWKIATPFGAALDWSVDVGVTLAIIGISGHMWLILIIAPLHAWAMTAERRFSGRSIVVWTTVVCLISGG